jgi:hypothetical protein
MKLLQISQAGQQFNYLVTLVFKLLEILREGVLFCSEYPQS